MHIISEEKIRKLNDKILTCTVRNIVSNSSNSNRRNNNNNKTITMIIIIMLIIITTITIKTTSIRSHSPALDEHNSSDR